MSKQSNAATRYYTNREIITLLGSHVTRNSCVKMNFFILHMTTLRYNLIVQLHTVDIYAAHNGSSF